MTFKETANYQNYVKKVPKEVRPWNYPQTPKKNKPYSNGQDTVTGLGYFWSKNSNTNFRFHMRSL